MADRKEELNYYEYWLTKDTWSLGQGVMLLQNHYCNTRRWTDDEDHRAVKNAFFDKFTACIGETMDPERLSLYVKDLNAALINGRFKIHLEESEIDSTEFIRWAFDNGYDMPEEFKYEIGEVEEVRLSDSYVARHAVQAVARLLWDQDITLKAVDIAQHKAVEEHCKAGCYTVDTRKRWIREVDPREPDMKPGAKKKSV